ncbi:12335_t:CDS:2, partial [Funneliformis geosporum]
DGPPDFKEARKWNDRSHKIYMYQPEISGNTINSGTINGGTFNNGLPKETVSKGSNQKKDESDDIDKFFKSPSERKSSNLFSQKTDNSTKKRRKSSNERGSCEVGNGKGKVDSISISDDSDYIPASEGDDNSDHVPSDIEDQCPPPLLLSSQLENFRESYKKMSVAHKWVLSSGKCVEDTLFKHCERLPVESILHSWVIDLDDHEVESLFTIEEWNEVQRAVKKMPEADRNFADSMMRFSDVQTTSDLRRVLKTTSYLNEDEPYDRLKHYDSEWAEIVMRKFLTYYEDPNEILQKQHLESWYDINVWSLIVDHGLCDVVGMETV